MQHFVLDRDQELTTSDIAQIIGVFETSNLPEYQKLFNYYLGKQAILQKHYADPTKPISKIVTNFCHEIVQQYSGYICGQPVKYNNDNVGDIVNILNYNDVATEDSELLKQALIYGIGFEINYIDLDGKQRFAALDTRQCIPIYSADLTSDLLYVIRFWRESSAKKLTEGEYYIEVYGPDMVRKYSSTSGFTSFTLISEEPHYFGQCPVSVFKLNEDCEGIYKQIIGLQDAYNELLSSQLDDYTSFVDCYMVLKGAIATEEDLAQMKENRVLVLDPDSSAEYLTKDINNTPVKEMLENYKEQIYNKTCCPDFTKDTFNAQTGIAIRYKLIQLDNAVANIEAQFKKALQRRIELICSVLYMTGNEEAWRDIEIVFTRNLPDTLMPANISELVQLKGLVSDETLLGLLSWIKDSKAELEKVKEQQESNFNLYNMGLNNGDRLLETSRTED